MACLGEGKRPNQNNISEPCSSHSVFLNADSGSRSWQMLLKPFWSYLKNWGTSILHINIHITLHFTDATLLSGMEYSLRVNDKPFFQKTPKLSQSADQYWAAPVFDTTKRMSCKYPLLHQNPVKEGGNLRKQSPKFAINSTAKAQANKYRLHCGI